jgi:predicted nucleic acid-binding protein
MRRQVILDTGRLAAFLNSRDKHHDWAEAQWAQTQPLLLTCEAVVSEACLLIRESNKGISSLFTAEPNERRFVRMTCQMHSGFWRKSFDFKQVIRE